MHDRVMQSLPRTNNAIEKWHNVLNGTVSNAHVNCFKVMLHFQDENKIARQATGAVNIGRQTKYVCITNNLRNLLNAYDRQNNDVFLRGVAYNINL